LVEAFHWLSIGWALVDYPRREFPQTIALPFHVPRLKHVRVKSSMIKLHFVGIGVIGALAAMIWTGQLMRKRPIRHRRCPLQLQQLEAWFDRLLIAETTRR
jgi:hypothetical protein